MTLREKVGQLFVVQPDALEEQMEAARLNDMTAEGTHAISSMIRERYAQYPCGGFVLFRKNLVNDEQVEQLTHDLHHISEIRPLIYTDEEGGRVARFGNHPSFDTPKVPSMKAILDTGDPEKAYEAGRTIGTYLKKYGIDVDFAPVADVNTNAQNPVIGDRAFGSDPETAAVYVVRYLDGLHDAGMMGCLKHFPGHGDTANDTHTGYAQTEKNWEQLLNCEMIPFRAGIGAGAEFIMTAHIAAPHVTGSREPCTVSRLVLTDKLRHEIGYDGLIITDALAMGAITQNYSSAEACIACIKAGVDILLMPYNYFEASDGVMKAVESGEISEARIDESVRRILRVKMGE